MRYLCLTALIACLIVISANRPAIALTPYEQQAIQTLPPWPDQSEIAAPMIPSPAQQPSLITINSDLGWLTSSIHFQINFKSLLIVLVILIFIAHLLS